MAEPGEREHRRYIQAVGTGLIIIWARDGNLRLIVHTIHNIAAFIAIIAAIIHAYLGSLANPGILRGIFEGKN